MSEKYDTLLSLSLDVPEAVRQDSALLGNAYQPDDGTWQVVFRYVGEEAAIEEQIGRFTRLSLGYGVADLDRQGLGKLAEIHQVVYIELPRNLDYEVVDGRIVSCVSTLYEAPYRLSGKGVLAGIVDSGIDLFHPDFRKEDGTTRLIGLWDMTESDGNAPEGYLQGRYYDEEELNGFLQAGRAPFRDLSGHGTHVAGIVAGNGRASRGVNRGIAYEADLLVVKMKSPAGVSKPQSAQMMMAVDFCCKMAAERGQPLALNLSYGTSYGNHSGRSLLDTYLDQMVYYGRNNIVVGAGNEGNLNRHIQFRLNERESRIFELNMAEGERNMGFWCYSYWQDSFVITLESPGGASQSVVVSGTGRQQWMLGGAVIQVYQREPSPYVFQRELLVEMTARDSQIQSGIWRLTFEPVQVSDGLVEIWLPSGSNIGSQTAFFTGTTENTVTIPGTAGNVITVGAYNARTRTYAPFSGRGPLDSSRIKPDLVAPGVDVISCSPGGGYTARTGTSMACPFVTGAAALWMQWGMVEGNDPYLYGEKMRAFLIGNARPLSETGVYPNNREGWGRLCAKGDLVE